MRPSPSAATARLNSFDTQQPLPREPPPWPSSPRPSGAPASSRDLLPGADDVGGRAARRCKLVRLADLAHLGGAPSQAPEAVGWPSRRQRRGEVHRPQPVDLARAAVDLERQPRRWGGHVGPLQQQPVEDEGSDFDRERLPTLRRARFFQPAAACFALGGWSWPRRLNSDRAQAMAAMRRLARPTAAVAAGLRFAPCKRPVAAAAAPGPSQGARRPWKTRGSNRGAAEVGVGWAGGERPRTPERPSMPQGHTRVTRGRRSSRCRRRRGWRVRTKTATRRNERRLHYAVHAMHILGVVAPDRAVLADGRVADDVVLATAVMLD
eukprot:9504058-Pyramimonas_sp.AAC.2